MSPHFDRSIASAATAANAPSGARLRAGAGPRVLRILSNLLLLVGLAMISCAVAAAQGWTNPFTTRHYTAAAIGVLAVWWGVEFVRARARRADRLAQRRETDTLLAHLNNTSSTGARR